MNEDRPMNEDSGRAQVRVAKTRTAPPRRNASGLHHETPTPRFAVGGDVRRQHTDDAQAREAASTMRAPT